MDLRSKWKCSPYGRLIHLHQKGQPVQRPGSVRNSKWMVQLDIGSRAGMARQGGKVDHATQAGKSRGEQRKPLRSIPPPWGGPILVQPDFIPSICTYRLSKAKKGTRTGQGPAWKRDTGAGSKV
jgi:hypothetical protein